MAITKTACVVVMFWLGSAACPATEKVTFKNHDEKINYSAGYQIGSDFRRRGMKLSAQPLVQGMLDAVKGSQPLMTTQAMQVTLIALQKRVAAWQGKKSPHWRVTTGSGGGSF